MPGELPVLELCNKYKPNPKLGHGPLGNQYEGRMFYDNKKGDRRDLVELLQTMLAFELHYPLGPQGRDGKFGGDTEKAVKEFQDEYKDFEGKLLREDRLVGPRTADALNRGMVGRWYNSYTTPRDLTKDTLLVTLTKDALENGANIEPKGVKRVKMVLVGHRNFIQFIDEIGIPIKSMSAKLKFTDGRVTSLTTDQKGKIHPKLSEGEEFSVEVGNIHEGADGNSIQTHSGQHFAANQSGPWTKSVSP